MEELKMAVMMVVKNRGRELTERDFVQYYSYIKNWIPPAYARRLFRICYESGLLKKEGEKYIPNFEFSGVIPIDFQITEEIVDKYSAKSDILARIIDRICQETGMPRRDVIIGITQIKGEAKYINMEVAALIYCKINGIDCSQFYDDVEMRLVV